MTRKKTLGVFCGAEGCHEQSFYSYDNRKQYSELFSKYGNGKWRCVRHTNEDNLLTPNNLKKQTDFIAGKSKKYPELKELFWNDGSGFTFGGGYKAFANDFPEGTILRITAEILLPNK